MQRHGLTEAEWARLEPFLPSRSRLGRPPRDHRTIVDVLIWLGGTGALWRDLPERFGPWRTAATRFYRWTRSGLRERVRAESRRIAEAEGGINREVHVVDGMNVRAHRRAAGGKGGGSARCWAAVAAANSLSR